MVLLFVTGIIGGGYSVSSAESLILEDSNYVYIVNVASLLNEQEIPPKLEPLSPMIMPKYSEDVDPEDFKDDWHDMWDAEGPPISLDELAKFFYVGGPTSFNAYSGSFVLDDLRSELEDNGYRDRQYRDQEIWERAGRSWTLMEGGGNSIAVAGSTADVQEVLKAIDRGQGFVDNEYPLKQVLDKAGDALLIRARTSCDSVLFGFELRGCEAGAEYITGGDIDRTQVSGVFVFGSDRRAESGAEDLEDAIEDQDFHDVDLEDVNTNGLRVEYEAVIYETLGSAAPPALAVPAPAAPAVPAPAAPAAIPAAQTAPAVPAPAAPHALPVDAIPLTESRD